MPTYNDCSQPDIDEVLSVLMLVLVLLLLLDHSASFVLVVLLK